MAFISVGEYVRSKRAGRAGKLVDVHATDPILTYKVAFLDAQVLPHSDWFSKEDISVCSETKAAVEAEKAAVTAPAVSAVTEAKTNGQGDALGRKESNPEWLDGMVDQNAHRELCARDRLKTSTNPAFAQANGLGDTLQRKDSAEYYDQLLATSGAGADAEGEMAPHSSQSTSGAPRISRPPLRAPRVAVPRKGSDAWADGMVGVGPTARATPQTMPAGTDDLERRDSDDWADAMIG